MPITFSDQQVGNDYPFHQMQGIVRFIGAKLSKETRQRRHFWRMAWDEENYRLAAISKALGH